MDNEQKAQRAKALLSDDLLNDAFASVEQRALDALTNCNPDDVPGLQSASQELRAARAVIAEVKSHIDTFEIDKQRGRHRG